MTHPKKGINIHKPFGGANPSSTKAKIPFDQGTLIFQGCGKITYVWFEQQVKTWLPENRQHRSQQPAQSMKAAHMIERSSFEINQDETYYSKHVRINDSSWPMALTWHWSLPFSARAPNHAGFVFFKLALSVNGANCPGAVGVLGFWAQSLTWQAMPRKPRVMLNELANLWDGDQNVRRQLREQHAVLVHDGPTFRPTVKSCSDNVDAILPVLQLTQE